MYPSLHLLLVLLRALSLSHARSVDDSDWHALNATVGGKLGRGIPLSRACFSTFNGKKVSVNTAECAEIEANYLSSEFRATRFGAYMQVCLQHFDRHVSSRQCESKPNWETCQSLGQNCLLDSTDPSNPAATGPPFTCDQGTISPYYVCSHVSCHCHDT